MNPISRAAINNAQPGKKAASATTVAILSILAFYIYVLIYSGLVYVQFAFTDVLKVAALFLGLFLILVAVFHNWLFRIQLKLDSSNIIWSFVVSFGLFALLNSSLGYYYSYYPTFPLLEAEHGLGWNSDSAFHVAIINSFNLLGYPSIAQHDAPYLNYHILSHFIDSILIRLSGVDAWESYGLFYFYKRALILASVVIFIVSVCKDLKYNVFLLSLLILLPMVVGSWSLTGSHGLWFTSLLVVLSSTYVYGLISKNKPSSNENLLLLFTLLIIISFGKVSTGFAYSVVIGFALFFINYKNLSIYVFGASLISFFALYGSSFRGGSDEFPKFGYFDFILLQTEINADQLFQAYLIITVAGIIALYFRKRSAERLFVAGLLTIIVISFVVINHQVSKSDVWYLVYGLTSVLLLLVYQTVVTTFVGNVQGYRNYLFFINHQPARWIVIFFIIALTAQLNIKSTDFSYLKVHAILRNIHHHPFARLNHYDKTLNATILKQAQGDGLYDLTKYSRSLKNLTSNLKAFTTKNNLERENLLLFIPKEIFENEFSQFGGNSWARGMFAYALTGIPLLHGIESLRKTYGYYDYDESALWVPRKSFNIERACEFGKDIIILEDFMNTRFSFVDCHK